MTTNVRCAASAHACIHKFVRARRAFLQDDDLREGVYPTCTARRAHRLSRRRGVSVDTSILIISVAIFAQSFGFRLNGNEHCGKQCSAPLGPLGPEVGNLDPLATLHRFSAVSTEPVFPQCPSRPTLPRRIPSPYQPVLQAFHREDAEVHDQR